MAVTLLEASAHRLASTAQPEVKGLVEALEKLEVANERLCAKRSAKTYDAMIHHDGCHDELIALDEARHTGRQALAAYREAQP
jgi:DNA transposition AAA+ family ATPase